jgi:NAD(P)-dependent dehydrogenase (short-subunit alcohol dehydrogenase family)
MISNSLGKLQDQVAIVTGAGSGIGRSIAELFAKEGAKVVIAELNDVAGNDVANFISSRGETALSISTDVANKSDVEKLISRTIEKFGRIDILVNNAAWSTGGDILEISEEEWDVTQGVSVKGVYLCCKAVLPKMMGQNKGVLVNISSVNGQSAFGAISYSAAKAGIINVTQNLAVSYGKYNIRANTICPGTVRTPVWNDRLKGDPQLFEKLTKWYPLGRIGMPEDVAKSALFLASEDASWITGATLVVDGGLTAGNLQMLRELEEK